MRKTIELTEDELFMVQEYQKRNQLRNFSQAVRGIIRTGECECKDEKDETLSDDNFALLADAIVKLDKKIDIIISTFAPKSAGKVN